MRSPRDGWKSSARPRCGDRAKAAEPVGKLCNCERIGVGIVVALQDYEICGDQERRAASTAWKEQDGGAHLGKTAAIGALEPALRPIEERAAARPIVKPLRHDDLKTPGYADAPT